jgi:hypothetical protein
MHAQAVANALITLTEAAKLMPGRPSTNCLWRWCRRGVLSRGGERIRLEHRRIGGKIFTAPDWLDEFGRKLAEADTRHFDQCGEVAADAAAKEPRIPLRRRRSQRLRPRHEDLHVVEDAERELDEAGIR